MAAAGPLDSASRRAHRSIREVKDRAYAAREKARGVRARFALHKRTSACGDPSRGASSIHHETFGALLEWCEATRGTSRQLAASAAVARRTAEERVHSTAALASRLLGLGSGG